MIFALVILSFISGLISLVVYLYYLKNGQFDNNELVKYQIFHEKDEEKEK